ncbi:MAG: HAD family hydrolase [Lachnospiraceae bacterium]|nr:HAD family hydrolase [Lachnospiraceae bacterium]
MYQYILFDLDGTLTDPKEGITRCVQYALHHFGIEEPDLDRLVPFIGPPMKDSFMRFYGMDSEQADEAVVYYRERFADQGIFENAVLEGIPEMLRLLQDQGKHLAVASSKPEPYVIRILERFALASYFEQVIGSEMSGERSRKAEVIQEAFRRFGIGTDQKDSVLMVGDRMHDIAGAAECGISSLGVRCGYAAEGELEQAGATYIADSVQDMREFLLMH